MKYIRTYETKEKFLTDKDSTSRVFRLKPTLYKYSEAGDHIHLEIDDPRKHGDSTWIRLEFTKATEFSFKISNVTGDDSNTLNYTIDWGDGTVETNTATRGDDKLYTFTHSYAIGTYNMELYGTDKGYMFVGDTSSYPQNTYLSAPSAVKSIIVGEGVGVGDYAFYSKEWWNYSITSVTIPEGISSIGVEAFSAYTSDNSSLTSVSLPSTLTSIEYGVFQNCSKLASINIPEGVTSIGNSVFQNCSSLESISLPSSLTYIGQSAFHNCSKLTSINIPDGVTSLEYSTLGSCSSLKSIKLPSTLTSVANMVFEFCVSLSSISCYNSTAPTLGYSVFQNMPKNGTLHIKPGATGYDAWLSLLPSGWTIVEDL